jgi:hypothetical protein
MQDLEHIARLRIAVDEMNFPMEISMMHPVFWPMHALVFWLDVMTLPWKMAMAPVVDSMTEVAIATSPAALTAIDTPSSQEIGTSSADFSRD